MFEYAMELVPSITPPRAGPAPPPAAARPAARPTDRLGPGPTAQMASVDASGFGPASPG